MSDQYKEKNFEDAIEDHLLRSGYEKVKAENFDHEHALFTSVLIPFIQETQPKEWEYLEKNLGNKAEENLIEDLCRALNSEHEGCLYVLRHGFKCFGRLFKVAFFAPASGLNPETQQLYQANRLTVTRQLVYNEQHGNSLDLVIGLNGIPIITMELKNPMTGQDWSDAVLQYKKDRDPNDLIFNFKKRALVHFALDTNKIRMATKLSRGSTFFLPFNKGRGMGAGNPDNPEGYNSSYLWEEVLQKDSLLDILKRYMHLHVAEKRVGGKKITKESMIFPRYHQLDAVRKIISDARSKGTGKNYLVQHSAGSGKSFSIAWLAYHLSSLHNEVDEKVYDSVVVVTDRLVLDQQLQNTIYQFEHKQGVVEKIEKDSTQLANALKSGTPIIITTLQKFPFVTEKIGDLPSRKYAVIIDEAHSSQSGESASEMKGVLAGESLKEEAIKQARDRGDTDTEEEILKNMAKRGKQPNISFFAFTATPKYKTIKVFGTPGPDSKPECFHLYSMRQAIEEGFILDVLKHYITYKSYFKLIKSIEDDPEVDKRKAARALARFMSFHPHNMAQKTEVMIEHFRQFVRHKIGGRAKAMVVTGSRLHAVRYKQTFDKYINEKGYEDIKVLVAFSGEVIDPDVADLTYTEVGMNEGIKEKELPKKFATDEYQVLIVAEKYQTGFDQPLLHTMYVDKRLSGIKAVQTLSRLNRTHPGKEDTFVLDFVNEREEILESFQPYYEHTAIGEEVDHRQLYSLQARLYEARIFYREEVEEFASVFFKPKRSQTRKDHVRMDAILKPPVDRFVAMDNDEREEFRHNLIAFRNLYAFLSQVIPFQDTDLEKLYTFIRFLLRALPKRDVGPEYDFGDDVALKYYRLQKISEGSIDLKVGEERPLYGPSEVGTGAAEEPKIELSRLIDLLNERFGTTFKPGDQLFFDAIKEDAVSDSNLRQAAVVNDLENFGYAFKDALDDLFIERMEQNEEITAKFLNESKFREAVTKHLVKQVYEQILQEAQTDNI